MKRIAGLSALFCFMPQIVLAGEGKSNSGSIDGWTLLAMLVLITCAAAVFGVWNFCEWIGAKADEAKERARKMKLENDKFEIEVAALKENANQD